MDTSHNHLREPSCEDYPFIGAKRYIDGLSQPEKEDILASMAKDVGKIRVENIPDEEDLTQVRQGCHHVLKFKDKIFNPAECSGMGKVFLRKNMVLITCDTSKNILTLSMFEDKHGLPMVNTIFIIQYDYDLDGGFITLPENSVLLFAGGSLRNGTVMLRNTLVLPVALDIEHYMSVNIRGAYKEGSLVYLRKKLRLFDGIHWITIGAHDLTPIMNAVKKYLNFALDIVAPFKIELSTEKKYIEHGLNNIRVSWSYNRLINNQDIRLESGHDVRIYEELDRNIRSYTFENVELNEPATIVVSTTYKGETVSEAVTLTFDKNPGLVIDDELDENSTNPVTNRAITRVIRQIETNIESINNQLESINNKFDDYLDIQEFNEYKTEIVGDLSEIERVLNNKVDKVSGKGLSTNDFTNTDKSKLDGIEAGAQKNPDLSGYATTASVNAAISGKQDKLPNGRTGEVLKWNGNSWQPGTDEQGTTEDVAREIRKLSLTKQSNNIQLTYDGQAVGNSVIDEIGSAEPTIVPNRFNEGEYEVATINGTKIYGKDTVGGSGGGLAPSDVVDLIENNLDIGHAGNTLKLKYGGSFIGYGTPDNTGGGGGDDDDDGLAGDILVYFLATTTSNTPSTPTDGQIEVVGNWVKSAPNHVDGQYIWMSQIYKTPGGSCGNWSTPVMIDDGSSGSSAGSDSDGREFIYARANIENWQSAGIPNPNTNPTMWPAQDGPWYDNPQGVTENMRFEFYSFKYKTGEDTWSAWQGPYIWSSYGKNGTDGDGVEYIFYAGSSIPTDDPFDWYNDNDSKSGGTDNDGVLFNSDEYIPRDSRWKDDPQDLEPGDTQWVSMRKYRNDVNPQSSEQGDSYWHQYSRPTVWNHYAMDITSAGALDFDNQTMGIPVNQSGNNSAFEEVSNAYIYYGAGTITIQNLTCTGLYYGNSSTSIWSSSEIDSRVIINGNKVTVRIPENTLTDIVGKTYVLKFEATAANVEPRTGSIKLVGLNTGKDGVGYRLDVGTAAIKVGVGTQTGLYVPSSIAPKMIKSDTNSSTAYSVSELPSSFGFDIYYAKDNNTPQKLTSNTVTVDNSITEKLIFQLKHNNVIIDEEVIPLVKDGAEGISATVYNIIPLSSSIAWDNTKTTGEITFNAYRKIGSDQEQLLTNGHFAGSDDSGRVEVVLKGNSSSKTISTTESMGAIYTAECNESTQYKTVQINLYVDSGNTETQVCSIVIPVVQAGSSGSQTLLQGIMRFRDINCSDGIKAVTFYDGRHPDPDANDGYFQDFVRWRVSGTPSDSWGTYMCIDKRTIVPNAIPSDSTHFIKLDYTFTEVTDYLIAQRAWIDNLSVRQVVVFDDASTPNIVAGMTSGSTLPTELTDKNYTNGSSDPIRIWAGPMATSDINSAPFTVSESGHLKATNATINGNGTFSGTINATDGSFTGTVNATSGSFVGDVTAKNFNVVNENNITVLQMSTWGEVSQDVDLSLIDSTTLSNLTSDSLVILLTDPSTNTKYLLNLISLTGSGTVGDPETFYEINKTGQTGVTVREKILIKDSLDIYHVNSSTLANGHYYEFVPSEGDLGASGVITKINLYYFVLQGAQLYKEVEFNNGNKSYVSPNPIDLIIDKSWVLNGTILSSGSLVSYIGTPEQLTSNVTAFNESTFIAGNGVDVSAAANSIASTPLRVTYTGQPTIYRADVNTSSSLVDFGQMTRLYYNSQLGPGFYSVNRN